MTKEMKRNLDRVNLLGIVDAAISRVWNGDKFLAQRPLIAVVYQKYNSSYSSPRLLLPMYKTNTSEEPKRSDLVYWVVDQITHQKSGSVRSAM